MASARSDEHRWQKLELELTPFGFRRVQSYGERIANMRSPLTRKLWQRRKGIHHVLRRGGHMAPSEPDRGMERKILLCLLAFLVVLAAVILAPFAPWFVLALWTAAIVKPLVERLTRATRGRRGAAALVMTGLIVIVGVPLTIGAITLGTDAVQLARRTLTSDSGRNALVQLVSPHDEPSPLRPEVTSPFSFDTLIGLAKEYGVEAYSAVSALAGALGALFLGVFVYLVATYGAMVQGAAAYRWCESQIPLAPETLRRMRDAFVETGRGLLASVVLTALVQAVVASVVYAILGVPRALILGFATFIAAMIPSVGSALVWLPVALGLLFADHPTRAAVLLALGVGVISTSDNVLRPLLARWGSLQLHPFLVLFSMLGGVMILGGWGLILGPLVLRLGLEVLSLVRESTSEDKDAPSAPEQVTPPHKEASLTEDDAALGHAHSVQR
jgi:predicted PurR-regulated permease PerM